MDKSHIRWLRDPLFICFAFGLVLFTLDYLWSQKDVRTVSLTESDIQSISDSWVNRMGRVPSSSELDGMIEDRTQEEMLVKEAVRLGLDRDDTIIRRHLMQKIRFMVEDAAVADPATDDELRSYFEANKEHFQQPGTVSFTHVFFDKSQYFDETEYRAIRDRLNNGLDPDGVGSPFIQGRQFKNMTYKRIESAFGHTFFAVIRELDPSVKWQGPIDSSFGTHLVRINQVSPVQQIPFEDALDAVRERYDLYRRDESFKTYLAELRSSYDLLLPEIATD